MTDKLPTHPEPQPQPLQPLQPSQRALPVLALLGPTASGKSGLSLQLADALAHRGLAVDLISVDSALVYRGMDIGTAKPTPDEQARARHHLIDLIDPTEAYSAMRFVADAHHCIADSLAAGRLPVLVGGTMLYFKALRDGIDDLPSADPTVRAQLDAQAQQLGWPALHAQLQAIDPVTAARLKPTDAQRIQRALEIWQLTGQPMSSLLRKSPAAADLPPLALTTVALMPAERSWLHQRIAQRFDQMLAAGFLDEMHTLRARGDLHPELPSMRCVGYRQAWDYLDGHDDAPTFRDKAIAATRQLAKRQLTWLRGLGEFTALDPMNAQSTAQLLDLALPWADQVQAVRAADTMPAWRSC